MNSDVEFHALTEMLKSFERKVGFDLSYFTESRYMSAFVAYDVVKGLLKGWETLIFSNKVAFKVWRELSSSVHKVS
jgi:hypothetical protein